MNVKDRISMDLHQPIDYLPFEVPFYVLGETSKSKLRMLEQQRRRAKSLKNRKEQLLVSYYIGQTLEVVPHNQRTSYIQAISHYTKVTAVRIYYLFELLEPQQILRTQTMTIGMIAKLKQNDYTELVEEAASIAGARTLEEEDVNI